MTSVLLRQPGVVHFSHFLHRTMIRRQRMTEVVRQPCNHSKNRGKKLLVSCCHYYNFSLLVVTIAVQLVSLPVSVQLWHNSLRLTAEDIFVPFNLTNTLPLHAFNHGIDNRNDSWFGHDVRFWLVITIWNLKCPLDETPSQRFVV